MKSARNWGDGHTSRSRHIVEDIQYGPTTSALRCADGTVLQAATPEALELLWQEHGGKTMAAQAEDRANPETLIDTARSMRAMLLVADIGSDCTCSITGYDPDCPNIIEGDLEATEEENS